MEVGGQLHAPAALLPGKNLGTLGGAQSRSESFEEEGSILPLAEFDHRTIQPLVYSYINYVTSAPFNTIYNDNHG